MIGAEKSSAEMSPTRYATPVVLFLEVLFVGALAYWGSWPGVLVAAIAVVALNAAWIARSSPSEAEADDRLVGFCKELLRQFQGRKPCPRDLGVVLIGIATLIAIGTIYSTVLPDTSPVDSTTAARNADVLGQDGLLAQVFVLVAGLLVAPVLEEVGWRGFVLDGIRGVLSRCGLPSWLAVGLALIVSSAAFGLAHEQYNLHDQVLVAATGLVYGLVFVSTRSVLLAALAHAAWNSLWVISVALG